MMITRDESAGYMTNWVARLFAKVVDRRLKPHGISSAHLPILFALSKNGTLSQKALTEAAAVEQPTMAATLARMERDGLIDRRPDDRDKRVALFSLTAAAQEKFRDAQKILQEINKVALADLTESERALFIASLGKVARALERLGE